MHLKTICHNKGRMEQRGTRELIENEGENEIGHRGKFRYGGTFSQFFGRKRSENVLFCGGFPLQVAAINSGAGNVEMGSEAAGIAGEGGGGSRAHFEAQRAALRHHVGVPRRQRQRRPLLRTDRGPRGGGPAVVPVLIHVHVADHSAPNLRGNGGTTPGSLTRVVIPAPPPGVLTWVKLGPTAPGGHFPILGLTCHRQG